MKQLKGKTSEATGKRYPLRSILKVAGLNSAAWYDLRPRKCGINRQRPGPVPFVNDVELLKHIKDYLLDPEFYGEGYQKIHARLKNKGIRVGKNRVYKIMKQENLLFLGRQQNGSSGIHDGTIITEVPNEMWATDGKEFKTKQDGKCWFMGVIDHFNDEIKSFHLTTKFDSAAAMEPLRLAVKKEFGSVEKNVCAKLGLALRADHGSQYDSKAFQSEVTFLGLEYSPSFVRSPECNGIIERFHRTLNEQIFSGKEFESIDKAKIEIEDFIERYNEKWILHRLGLKSPNQYKREFYAKNQT